MTKWLFLKGELSNLEISARMKYLFEIFHSYYISYRINGNLMFIPFPFRKSDTLFIVGHNSAINNFLSKNRLKYRKIVLISCNLPESFLLNCDKVKEVYTSCDDSGRTEFFDGLDWGFNFPITKPEINLFNCRSLPLSDNIKLNFRRLK